MPNTYQTTTAGASPTTYQISFPFLAAAHVKVTYNGVATSAFSLSTNTLTLSPYPAEGTAIRIYRETPSVTPLVDFKDGSTLLEADLDTQALQNFYIAQETQEGSLRTDFLDGNYNADSKRIKAVAVATAPTDALNASLASGNIYVGDSAAKATSRAVTGDILLSNTGVASIAAGVVVNADINSAAAIDVSKLGALTANKAVATGAGGLLAAATTSATELNYLVGTTSAVQSQLTARHKQTRHYTLAGAVYSGNTNVLATSTAPAGALTSTGDSIEFHLYGQMLAAFGSDVTALYLPDGSSSMTGSTGLFTTLGANNDWAIHGRLVKESASYMLSFVDVIKNGQPVATFVRSWPYAAGNVGFGLVSWTPPVFDSFLLKYATLDLQPI